MEITQLFVTMLVVMGFFSFAITGISHAMCSPGNAMVNACPYLDEYLINTGTFDMAKTAEHLQTGMSNQAHIPIIETGALLFYSGNFLIDLLLNFFFAPSIVIGLFMHGVTDLIGIQDSTIWIAGQATISALIMCLYAFGLIQLVMGVRSGRVV